MGYYAAIAVLLSVTGDEGVCATVQKFDLRNWISRT